MKKWQAVLALLIAPICTFAQGPAGAGTKEKRTADTAAVQAATPRPKKPFLIRFAIAGGACGLGIGLSANPATSAEIGIPILLGGNYAAWKLYQNHPKWSAFIQTVSPLGCFGYKRAKHPKKASAQKPPQGPPSGGGNPPSGGGNPPSGGGTGGGNSGSGGNGGSGGGNSGSGSGGSGGSNGGSGSGGSSGGSGNGGGSGSGGGNGGGGNGGGSGCVQDCGFPGNGGVNGGHDVKKPPFPGKGNGGSNAGNGKP